jgi:hypothetical protein
MMRIYKYPFVVTDEQTLELPEGAKLLSVQMQFDIPCLWALVDEKALFKRRKLTVHGTGNPINSTDNQTYLGTIQMREGQFVWHVFITDET